MVVELGVHDGREGELTLELDGDVSGGMEAQELLLVARHLLAWWNVGASRN